MTVFLWTKNWKQNKLKKILILSCSLWCCSVIWWSIAFLKIIKEVTRKKQREKKRKLKFPTKNSWYATDSRMSQKNLFELCFHFPSNNCWFVCRFLLQINPHQKIKGKNTRICSFVPGNLSSVSVKKKVHYIWERTQI